MIRTKGANSKISPSGSRGLTEFTLPPWHVGEFFFFLSCAHFHFEVCYVCLCGRVVLLMADGVVVFCVARCKTGGGGHFEVNMAPKIEIEPSTYFSALKPRPDLCGICCCK